MGILILKVDMEKERHEDVVKQVIKIGINELTVRATSDGLYLMFDFPRSVYIEGLADAQISILKRFGIKSRLIFQEYED